MVEAEGRLMKAGRQTVIEAGRQTVMEAVRQMWWRQGGSLWWMSNLNETSFQLRAKWHRRLIERTDTARV